MLTCSIQPLAYTSNPGVYFERIRHEPGAILLDSGCPQATRGRYDILSAWPVEQLSWRPDTRAQDFLASARTLLTGLQPAGAPVDTPLPFTGGLIGHLDYTFGAALQGLGSTADTATTRLGLYTWALITDHKLQTTQLVFHPQTSACERARITEHFQCSPAATDQRFSLKAPFTASLDRTQYHDAIARIQQYILAGDCYQVNFTQRFSAPCTGDPWGAYVALRQACPTPFAGFQALDGSNAIVSLSPERFIRVQDRQVETRPIKGTQPRGANPSEDQHNARQLLESIKDRAENLMIVDLLRNDLGRSCRTGSIRVPELFSLETYPNVHHLVSAVTGELAPGKDVFDLIEGSFPGGSITGAPKLRAMQIIEELEADSRAAYCGSLLYVDCRGEMDSSITIRTLLVRDDQVYCWGGGGIVTDSQWEAEHAESLTKVRILLNTLEQLQA